MKLGLGSLSFVSGRLAWVGFSGVDISREH